MVTREQSQLLRPDLLEGVSILIAGAGSEAAHGSFAAAVRDTCLALGARVSDCRLPPASGAREAAVGAPRESGGAEEGELAGALARAGELDMLVVDCAGLFAHALAGERAYGRSALSGCLEASWSIIHAVVNDVFLARGGGGRIVLLAPPPDADGPDGAEHVGAACSGLENLARTLSIEWARRQITTVAIATRTAAAVEETAELTAYLASPAGAYFSGCLLDLRGPRG